jgi:ABC-type arginine/histidine transport system permease subunit
MRHLRPVDMRHYWNRDTARYGLRRLVLCTACAAALQGHVYQREVPAGAVRAIRRGAA